MNNRSPLPNPNDRGRSAEPLSVRTVDPVRRGWAGALLVNVAYATCLAVASLTAAPPRVPIVSRTDWLAHGVAYGIQVLLLFELIRRLVRPPGDATLLAAAVALVFGTVMETLQLLQPARFFEYRDLVANATGVGAAAALLAASRLCDRRRRTERVR